LPPGSRSSPGCFISWGLLRQYLPRTADLRRFCQADLDRIAAELNGRPRQTLGFKTPSQVLAAVLR
jgi:transposase, IS30 family